MNFEKNIEKTIQLEHISLNEDFAKVIDKINQNFREIKVAASWSSAYRGAAGIMGARGKEGPSDESYRSLLKFYNAIGSNDTFISDKESVITNRRTDITLYLSDVYGDSLGTLDTYTDTAKFTSDYSPEFFKDYRLKISAGIKNNSKGRHIHLTNSTNIKKSKEFLKKSGYTINVDADKNNNTETLHFKFEENTFIPNHTGDIKFTGEKVVIEKVDSYNSFEIEAIKEENATKAKTLKLRVNNYDNVPDVTILQTVPYSGHIGVWNDFNGNVSEDFIQIESENLKITFAQVQEGSAKTDLYYNNQSYVRLRDDSYIQFKRLGTQWSIYYYLFIQKEQDAPVSFALNKFRLDIQRITGACISNYNTISGISVTSSESDTISPLPEFSDNVGFAYINAKPNGFAKINDSFSLYGKLSSSVPYYTAQNDTVYIAGHLEAHSVSTPVNEQNILAIEILPFEYAA